jgi:3-methyladenine DNA glycosylase Tag
LDKFHSIFERAAQRKGGETALEALLPRPKSRRALLRISDDRYLAEMTACVFRSGFVWKIIEAKWPAFEEVFAEFDTLACAMLADEDLETIVRDVRIVRHAKKIRAVRNNARFVREVKDSHGSFAKYIAGWPVEDIVGLWAELKDRGDRLGGQTGRYFLRFMGKDTPVLSRDVVQALISQDIIDKTPTSKKALVEVQAAFNDWAEESGRSLSEISRVLAYSIPSDDAAGSEKVPGSLGSE